MIYRPHDLQGLIGAGVLVVVVLVFYLVVEVMDRLTESKAMRGAIGDDMSRGRWW